MDSKPCDGCTDELKKFQPIKALPGHNQLYNRHKPWWEVAGIHSNSRGVCKLAWNGFKIGREENSGIQCLIGMPVQ